MKRFVALAMALAPAACVAQSTTVQDGAASISEEDFLRKVGVIAHDSMAGRDTPSPGLDATAAWLASELERMGLRGGAEGGAFIQHYPVTATRVEGASSSLSAGGTTLAYGPDVLPLRGSGGGVERTAELVLLSGSSDDFPEVSEKVHGRHAVLVQGETEAGLSRRSFRQLLSLANAGAASVWIVTAADDGAWKAAAGRAFAPSVAKGWGEEGEQRRAPTPMIQVRRSAFERLVGRRIDLAALEARVGGRLEARLLEGLAVSLRQAVVEEHLDAPNVVGILDGSDPELRSEYVAYSAHMDHIGVGAPNAEGDSIFNGADDDASGTVAVLEIAEAMSSLSEAPRRSSIFLFVSGEEKGLWGSEWYAEHPSVPTQSIVADLNMDMVGRNWPDTIVAIGREHSDLGETLDAVNAAHPELGMTAIDDLWPDQRFYFRSDHFNFARKGVPILFFFNGTHDDYHGPDDEPDRIDGDKAARIARLVYWLGLEISSRTERPQWDPASYESIVQGR